MVRSLLELPPSATQKASGMAFIFATFCFLTIHSDGLPLVEKETLLLEWGDYPSPDLSCTFMYCSPETKNASWVYPWETVSELLKGSWLLISSPNPSHDGLLSFLYHLKAMTQRDTNGNSWMAKPRPAINYGIMRKLAWVVPWLSLTLPNSELKRTK